MAEQGKHHDGYGPLSAEARAWELEQLRAMRLDDVEWDPEVQCPWCAVKAVKSTTRRRRHRAGWSR
jgi:hypothetical protein